MGTNKTWLLVLCFICCWSSVVSQSVLETYPVFTATSSLRSEVVGLAITQLNVREKTGKNDGVDVEKYLRSVNLRRGDQWCAAFISWLHIEKNVPNPESGYSPNWFKANIVYRRGEKRIVPFTSRPGQVIGLYIESKKRIGHVGMIESENRLHYNTIEGNTNSMGSDEGDGVYRKIRKKETISVISDYVGWREYREGINQLKKK